MPLTLPAQSDLNMVYGTVNINQWADADNLQDAPTITARCNWAINIAYNYILGRLSDRYDISTFVSLPAVIFELITKRAGIELYRSPRGLVDGDPATASLNSMSLEVESKLDQILSGLLQLLDAPVNPTNVPGVNNCTARFPLGMRYNQQQWDGTPLVDDCTQFYVSQ